MLVASHRPGRNLTEVTVTETSVILRSEYGHLRLMEMENGILRVTFTRPTAICCLSVSQPAEMSPDHRIVPRRCCPSHAERVRFVTRLSRETLRCPSHMVSAW